MSKNGNGNGRGRIITGPDDLGDPPVGQDPPIPALNNYWVVWFNPESEKVERVVLQAHTVDIHDDGMLVFKAFTKVTNPELLAMGAPPVMGYYVSSFRNHIRFGQDVPIDGKVH